MFFLIFKEILFYCEVDTENISIHRGDVSGPVIATTESFQGKDGLTEIKLVDPPAVVPIRHKHHTLPLMHGHTQFKVDGKQYQWKKHMELVEEGRKVILARYNAIQGDKDARNIGTLTVTPEGQGMLNLAVITCLIDHERADEGKWKVRISIIRR